jgi:hypothetical protein
LKNGFIDNPAKYGMIDLYHKHYSEMKFERAGLFELVQQTCHSIQALYPGCFVHITPSLFFPHVVYVDRHPDAQTFFADLEGVSLFISRNKHYRRLAYIRFIAQDFTAPLPLPKDSFDLLISICYLIYDFGDIIMMRKCMLGIKERAEKHEDISRMSNPL